MGREKENRCQKWLLCWEIFQKSISSSDVVFLGKANIYHKPRKTGFGKFVKFLDLISAKYIRPFPLCPVLSKSISFYPASQSLSSRKTEFSGPKFISLCFFCHRKLCQLWLHFLRNIQRFGSGVQSVLTPYLEKLQEKFTSKHENNLTILSDVSPKQKREMARQPNFYQTHRLDKWNDTLIKIQRKYPTKSTSLQGHAKFVFSLKRSEPH